MWLSKTAPGSGRRFTGAPGIDLELATQQTSSLMIQHSRTGGADTSPFTLVFARVSIWQCPAHLIPTVGRSSLRYPVAVAGLLRRYHHMIGSDQWT